MYAFVRPAANDAGLGPRLGALVSSIDPLTLVDVRPLSAHTAEPMRGQRVLMTVALAFTLIACALASAGTYSMVMFAVRRRMSEAAIRLALGGSTAHVRATFMRVGLLPAMAGVALGVAAFRPAGVLVRAQLFHVRSDDPAVLAIATTVLAVAAGIAATLPSRRAVRVNLVQLLREE
jgi:ABC-type lipoprotein release transport system permease subunit